MGKLTQDRESWDARERELLDRLGELNPESDEYAKVAKNLETIARLKNDRDKVWNDYYAKNEQMDLDHYRAQIDEEKNKITKSGNRIGLVQTIIGLGASGAFAWIAYHGEEVKMACRPVLSLGSSILNTFTRRK